MLFNSHVNSIFIAAVYSPRPPANQLQDNLASAMPFNHEIKGGAFEHQDTPFSYQASEGINEGRYDNEWVVNRQKPESDKVHIDVCVYVCFLSASRTFLVLFFLQLLRFETATCCCYVTICEMQNSRSTIHAYHQMPPFWMKIRKQNLNHPFWYEIRPNCISH